MTGFRLANRLIVVALGERAERTVVRRSQLLVCLRFREGFV